MLFINLNLTLIHLPVTFPTPFATDMVATPLTFALNFDPSPQ